MQSSYEQRLGLIDPALYANDWQINGAYVDLGDGLAHLVVSANPRRVSIIFSALGSTGYYLWFTSEVSSTLGLYVPSSGGPTTFELSLSKHGGLVQMPWYAQGIGFPAGPITYIETLWIPKGAG
jgi:hypothetical protein